MAESKTKIKKKEWIKIVAPSMFHESVIGETSVVDIRKLLGRIISSNLMTLTNEPKKQNIIVKFSINSIKGNSVGTEVIGYSLLPTFVKRLIRKGKGRVDDSFVIKSGDNKTLRVKPFLLTLNKTKKSVLSALRKAAYNSLSEKISKMSYEDIIKELIEYKLQITLKRELSKIYPLRVCEIRVIELVKEKARYHNIIKKTEKKEKKIDTKEVKEKPKEENHEGKNLEEKKEVSKKEENPEKKSEEKVEKKDAKTQD